MDVLAIDKRFYGKNYDVFSRYRGTNNGLIEEVKNGKFRLEEFKDGIRKLENIKGKTIDNINIVEVRLTVSKEFFAGINEDLINEATQKGISIVTFKGVK